MKWIIDKIIETSVRNRWLVLLGALALFAGGIFAVNTTPVDAIPDLSENQVIVWADWMGRSPKEVEEQVTYPLSVNLQGLAGVKSIRATSEFGFSMINIIFDDEIDFYFARQRVMERLSIATGYLPPGVVPYLAPDATALGQIFWYTVEGEGKSLDELRAIQDWYVRYQLNSVPGVVEVGSVGGFVREYQVDVDPEKLRAYDISLGQVFGAVAASNSSVGGKVIHKNGAEYLVRGTGWIKTVDDIRSVVVVERHGVPITIEQVGTVQLGPAFRRSLLEKDGREAVGGVVMMRYGLNPLEITERVKEKIGALQKGLPEGVRIVPFYDRTGLIHASIHTLTGTLVEEIIITSLVVLLILWHLRSAFVICCTIPLAVLSSFVFMRLFKIPSNIMSLSGIAISIGVLVDASIVMTENAYHRLHDHFKGEPVSGDTSEIVIEACKVVGQPLFFSIAIMLLSFGPIFVLGGMEGRMFNPLAYTKSFALLGVAVLAITLVPAIIPWFLRGRLKSQEDVWLVRSFANIYRPMLKFFIDHPDSIVVLTGAFLVSSLHIFPWKAPWSWFVIGSPFLLGMTWWFLARHKTLTAAILVLIAFASWRTFDRLGEEFMPPLGEMAIMDMPTTTPNVNISQAGDDIKERDNILKGFPEVHQVVGKVGRAETPTDPAPIDMVETVVSFRPAAWWPKRKILYDDLLAEGRVVRDELERRGLLLGRAERTSRLKTRLGEAAAALETVTPPEPEEIRASEALSDAHESWKGDGAVVMAFMAAKPVYAKLSHEPGKRPRAEAWRSAAAALRRPLDREISAVLDDEDRQLVNTATMDASVRIDRTLRELARRRLIEHVPAMGAELIALLRESVVAMIRDKGVPVMEAGDIDRRLAAIYAPRFDEWVLQEDVSKAAQEIVDGLVAAKDRRGDLLVEDPSIVSEALTAFGFGHRTPQQLWRDELEARRDALMRARIRVLNWELADQAAGAAVWQLAERIVDASKPADLAARTAGPDELVAVRDSLEKPFARGLLLWRKVESDLRQEMDSELQVPGWGNIWTRPIQNRIDMLATGVRTMVGVKVFGDTPEKIQEASEKIAAVLKGIHGAVDVFADQTVGENYLEIEIDRAKAARYGVSVEAIQQVIEVALGGRQITLTVEGRQRFPVRVRYPRDWRADEEKVKSILVTVETMGGGGGMEGMPGGEKPWPKEKAKEAASGSRLRQVPLSLVASVKITRGPSMIKSENGSLRSYVQLNVRERDIVGFVEEAQQAVAARVVMPAGVHVEWSGQFEHQVHAQTMLRRVFPVVIVIIFLILYITYKDLPDTFMMFLAVPGAVAGGALFQYVLPIFFGLDISRNFSVAVWVGYIACFGLATETGIVMLVYLRESIERRGGVEKIGSEAEIREAVMEGAVNRLRPKLLTEGTTILALIPMLWATGVGAEFMRPMALPILGGILVADEVIDLLIPVLFYYDRCRRLKKRLAREAKAA